MIFSANTDSVVVVNVIIQDIKATGNMIVNNGRGMGNVTGWTIRKDNARTLYWVGGTGDWFDPTHWSLASGGAGGACNFHQSSCHLKSCHFFLNSYLL